MHLKKVQKNLRSQQYISWVRYPPKVSKIYSFDKESYEHGFISIVIFGGEVLVGRGK